MASGVPQESMLGATIWYIMYDGVLKIAFRERCEAFAYAYDLVLVIGEMNKEKIILIGAC